MALLFFVLIVAAGTWVAFNLLRPYWTPGWIQSVQVRTRRHQAVPLEPSEVYVATEGPPRAIDTPIHPQDAYISTMPLPDKVVKLEYILQEKNHAIERLEKALDLERSHRVNFEQVKVILDEEIQRLKGQIKALKHPKEEYHA